MREHIYSIFAKAIIDFSEHKTTRKQLYETFCWCVANADENERTTWEKMVNAEKKFFEDQITKPFHECERPDFENNMYINGRELL